VTMNSHFLPHVDHFRRLLRLLAKHGADAVTITRANLAAFLGISVYKLDKAMRDWREAGCVRATGTRRGLELEIAV